jgi:hypothetical protein
LTSTRPRTTARCSTTATSDQRPIYRGQGCEWQRTQSRVRLRQPRTAGHLSFGPLSSLDLCSASRLVVGVVNVSMCPALAANWHVVGGTVGQDSAGLGRGSNDAVVVGGIAQLWTVSGCKVQDFIVDVPDGQREWSSRLLQFECGNLAMDTLFRWARGLRDRPEHCRIGCKHFFWCRASGCHSLALSCIDFFTVSPLPRPHICWRSSSICARDPSVTLSCSRSRKEN